MTENHLLQFDTLIIGSGLAGLTLAIKLAEHRKVGLITKRSLLDGASGRAQGGIAAVLSDNDSLDAHIQDTLTAKKSPSSPRNPCWKAQAPGRRAASPPYCRVQTPWPNTYRTH